MFTSSRSCIHLVLFQRDIFIFVSQMWINQNLFFYKVMKISYISSEDEEIVKHTKQNELLFFVHFATSQCCDALKVARWIIGSIAIVVVQSAMKYKVLLWHRTFSSILWRRNCPACLTRRCLDRNSSVTSPRARRDKKNWEVIKMSRPRPEKGSWLKNWVFLLFCQTKRVADFMTIMAAAWCD